MRQDDKNYPAISSQTRSTAFQKANAAMRQLLAESSRDGSGSNSVEVTE